MLTGWNWDAYAQPALDAAVLKARGGTICRITIGFCNDGSGVCAPFPNAKNDAYSPGSPGNLDPSHVADLDAKVQALSAAGIWIDLGIFGGDCAFYSNPIYIPQWVEAWSFLAARYANTDYMAFYEPLIEPHPQGDTFNNVLVSATQQKAIAAIRAADPYIPIMLGAAKNYNLRNVAQVYLPNIPNLLYTGNFYELGSGPNEYVKQANTNPPTSLPWNNNPPYGGYPGYYFDNKGGQPNAGGSYYGKGTTVYMDQDWLGVPGDGSGNGLLSVLTKFSAQYNVPVFMQQMGIRSVTPNSLQYATDMIDNFNGAGFGWTYWTYRTTYGKGSLLDGDIGLIWEDAAGGWHDKLDWLNAISSRFVPAPAPPTWNYDNTWTSQVAGGAPVSSISYNPKTKQAYVVYAAGGAVILVNVPPVIQSGLALASNQQVYAANLVLSYRQ